MVHKVLNGFNSTILVYGQTGSGKTYTMQGLTHATADYHQTEHVPFTHSDEDGVSIRAIDHLFSNLSPLHEVHMTMFQIYNEKVYDLLNFNIHGNDSSNRVYQSLKVTATDDTFQVNNLFAFKCRDKEDAYRYY